MVTETTTPEETAAKDALVKATEHLTTAQMELIMATGGADIVGPTLQCQLLVCQLDALVQVLVNAGAIDRIVFWTICADKMRAAEAGLRKAVLNLPKIQLPAGNLPKTN